MLLCAKIQLGKEQTLKAIICATGSPCDPPWAKSDKSPIRSKTLWRQGSSKNRKGGFNQPSLTLKDQD